MSDRHSGIGRPFPYTQRNAVFYLIGINVAVFLINRALPRTVFYLALNPVLFAQNRFIWTLATYMFVHGGFFHLLFNMAALYFFGRPLEHRLGTWEFLSYYLLTGILSGFFTYIFYVITGADRVFLMGASGAIFALLLAFAAFFPGARVLVWFFPMPAPLAVAFFGAMSLFSQISGRGGNIAHLTHLSGLLFGYLYFRIRLGGDPIRAMVDYWRRR